MAFLVLFRTSINADQKQLVDSDIISGVALDYVGIDVRANSGDSKLNSDQIIRHLGWPDPFYALLCSI